MTGVSNVESLSLGTYFQGQKMSVYQKFCYWVDSHGLETVRRGLGEREIQLPDETLIPCRVLRRSTEISCIVPHAWEGFCKRRTSWYLESEKAGQSLIVSKVPLDFPGLRTPILITESDFEPDRLPTSGEMAELVQSVPFQKRKPRLWDKIEPIERDFQRRWFERQETNESFDFDKIFVIHSANHSNFIDPKFYVLTDRNKAPYSIAGSAYVCSSCLEFFDILGDQWPLKYVVPCMGAVQFARLPGNRYFRVESGGGIEGHFPQAAQKCPDARPPKS